MSSRNMTRIARTTVAAAALAGLTGVAGAAPASAATARWQLSNLDNDRCWDAATLDQDFNGYAEDVWLDLDNDCAFDTRYYNTRGGDAFYEELSYDMNENGRPEYVLQDTDQRTGFEYVWFDFNQDGRYESVSTLWAATANSRQRSENQALQESNVHATNINIMATMPGFVSTLGELKTVRPASLR